MADIPNQTARRSAQFMDKLQEAGSEAKRTAQESLSHLRGKAGEYYQEGRRRLGDTREMMGSRMEHRPVMWLLGAAACGFLVGVLVSRR